VAIKLAAALLCIREVDRAEPQPPGALNIRQMIIDEHRLGRDQAVALREMMENLRVGLHQAYLPGDHDAAKSIPMLMTALQEREDRGGHIGEAVERHPSLRELVQERYGIGQWRERVLDVLHESAHLGDGAAHPRGEALDGDALAQGAAIEIDPVRMADDGIAHPRARGLIGVEARDDGLGLPAHEHAAEIENDVAGEGCVHRLLLIVTGVMR
jgi:hypothetical protein